MNTGNMGMGMNPMAGMNGAVMGGPVQMMQAGMMMGQQPQPQPGQPHIQPPPPVAPQMGQQPNMQMPQSRPPAFTPESQHRMMLNTYIYQYFTHFGMIDCARAMYNNHSAQLLLDEDRPTNPTEAMDTDNKDETKVEEPLPEAKIPVSSDTSFLLEWFSLFWDIFHASKGSGKNVAPAVHQYVNHTQNQATRGRQGSHGAHMYAGMMRPQTANMMMKPGAPLARAAMANNTNGHMMMQQQQQQQKMNMPRDNSMDGARERPSSPGAGDVSQSPSKKARVDGGSFNHGQQGLMMNGRPPMVQQGMNGPNGNPTPLLLASGINPGQLMPQQMQQFQNNNQTKIATYAANLQHHHGAQMPQKPIPAAPARQGSPMNQPGGDGPGNGGAVGDNAAGRPNQQGGGGNANGSGNGNTASGQSNHALQDYQMQLMMLEQQNKKRLLIARQEQETIGGGMPRTDSQNVNGQGFPENSPQIKPGNSPNPTDIKRTGGPMNGTISSPAPADGPQNQGSPGQMGFMPGDMQNGPQGFMASGQMAHMRPPSSHPNFGPNMSQQLQRQQPGGGQNPSGQWQPNGMAGGNPMMGQPGGQPGPGGPGGTPQQRAMPPPSAPNAQNQRTSTSSPQLSGTPAPPTPQQASKPAPKKKESKAAKAKKSAAAATPAADAGGDDASAPPTPLTPATQPFKPNAPVVSAPQVSMPNTQPSSVAGSIIATTASENAFDSSSSMAPFATFELADPLNTDNVLEGFDFDAFIQTDGDTAETFDFTNFAPIDSEINAD